MKTHCVFLIAAILVLAACDNNKPEEKTVVPVGEGKNTEITDPVQKAIREMEKRKEELGKLSPVTDEELKALIPATLLGANSNNPGTSSANGAHAASAEFEINDSTRIMLTIYDCSGPAGAGFYGMNFASLMNSLHDSEEEYLKSFEFKGEKAFEQCDKTTFNCTISFFAGGRFLVTLEGDPADAETLRDAAKALDIR